MNNHIGTIQEVLAAEITRATISREHAEAEKDSITTLLEQNRITKLESAMAAINAQKQITGLDIPDGVGWWAFRGTYQIVRSRQIELVINIVEWEPDSTHPYYRFQGEEYGHILKEEAFKETYIGEWYRLTMPWNIVA